MLHAPEPDKMPGPLAPSAATGHFDELRGGSAGNLAAHWAAFFSHAGANDPAELNRRSASLEHQVRDNGVTYNVYADAGGPQRPWSGVSDRAKASTRASLSFAASREHFNCELAGKYAP